MTDGPVRGPAEGYALSEQRRDAIFAQQIVPERFSGLQAVPGPTVFFIGGQPGAGKTALQHGLEHGLRLPAGSGRVAEIGPDLFRSYHPRYHELVERDDQRTSFHTNADAGAWVQRAIALTQRAGTHVMLEGTLRQPEITIDTARGYLEHGFVAELHVPAVHEYVSRLYIIRRYLGQLVENGHGRYTIRSAHDSAYQQLPTSLTEIAASGVMQRIVLHGPTPGDVVEVQPTTPDAGRVLRSALSEARRAPHLSREVIQEELRQQERIAQRFDRRECLADIRALDQEIAD